MTQELGETSKPPKGRISPQSVFQRVSRRGKVTIWFWASVRPHPPDATTLLPSLAR